MTELLRLDGVRKSFGDHVVLRERRPDRRAAASASC